VPSLGFSSRRRRGRNSTADSEPDRATRRSISGWIEFWQTTGRRRVIVGRSMSFDIFIQRFEDGDASDAEADRVIASRCQHWSFRLDTPTSARRSNRGWRRVAAGRAQTYLPLDSRHRMLRGAQRPSKIADKVTRACKGGVDSIPRYFGHKFADPDHRIRNPRVAGRC